MMEKWYLSPLGNEVSLNLNPLGNKVRLNLNPFGNDSLIRVQTKRTSAPSDEVSEVFFFSSRSHC